MAKTLDEYLAKRPGCPEAQERHMERMLAEVRAYKLREMRANRKARPVSTV